MKHRILCPSGILDASNSSQLRIESTNSISTGFDTVIVDFQDVTFMNSSAIGVFISMLKEVRASGGDLILLSLNPSIQMIFELTSMDRFFTICNDRSVFEAELS